MSTVAPPVRPAKARSPRHGTCKLRVFINSDEYSLKRQPAPRPSVRVWALRKLIGDRAGASYTVRRAAGRITCSCPDFANNKFACKHVKALVALGLLSGRKRPAPAAWVIEAPRSPAARTAAAAIVARAAQLGTAPARREGGAR